MSTSRLPPLRRFIRFAVLTCGALGLASAAGPARAGTVADTFPLPQSNTAVTPDGQFTAGGEWADVTPVAYIYPDGPGGTLYRTDPDDPRADGMAYIASNPVLGGEPGARQVSVGFDNHARTDQTFDPGEFIADLSLSITQANTPPGVPIALPLDITVSIRGAQSGGNPFDVFLTVASGGEPAVTDQPVALEDVPTLAVGFGSSPFWAEDHMILEFAGAPQAILNLLNDLLPNPPPVPITLEDLLPVVGNISVSVATDDGQVSGIVGTVTVNEDRTGLVDVGAVPVVPGGGPNPIPLPPALWAGLAMLAGVAFGQGTKGRRTR